MVNITPNSIFKSMTAKEILEKVKATFNTLVTPQAPTVPAAAAVPPAAPAAPAPKVYKLKDGGEISIAQAAEIPAVGDAVMVNGAPATSGAIFTLEDGSTITVDAAGKISAIAPAAPVTNDLSNAPAASVAPTVIAPTAMAASTPEEIKALVESFASSGTVDEQIAKLQVVCRALMEQCMGYELREAERKLASEQAIEIYKTDLKTAQAALTAHTDVTGQLITLCEELAKVPTADPKTLDESKKEKFERAEKRENRIASIGNEISKLRKPQSV
jgi:hypothetical protein